MPQTSGFFSPKNRFFWKKFCPRLCVSGRGAHRAMAFMYYLGLELFRSFADLTSVGRVCGKTLSECQCRSSQKNSCPNGMKIFSPASRGDWKTFLTSAGPLRAPHWIIDVTRPQNGCGGCKKSELGIPPTGHFVPGRVGMRREQSQALIGLACDLPCREAGQVGRT